MKYLVTSAPHLRSKTKTGTIMRDVMIALLPALAAGILRFGLRALVITAVSVAAALVGELICDKLIYHRNTLPDLSWAVTGMLLALAIPVSVPYWLVAVGSLFAVIVVKGFCGGIGKNIFNPALAARAFMLFFWPVYLVRFPAAIPSGAEGVDAAAGPTVQVGVDMLTGATPLHHMQIPALPEISLQDMFLGKIDGSMGEICTLALLIGGAYLLVKRVISWRIPVAYLGSVAIVTLIFYKGENPVMWMLYSLLGGGVVLAAFFMATDYSSSPVTPIAQLIYGAGCGILTVIFRYYGLFPEGVTYAILLMNAVVWALDYYTAPRRFGTKKGGNS